MSPEERSALALEKIADLLNKALPPPFLPQPPAEPWGADHISYLDEEELLRLEQEEQRSKERGLPATGPSADSMSPER